MTTSSERVTATLPFHSLSFQRLTVVSSNLRGCRRWCAEVAVVCTLWLLLGAIAAPAHAQNVTFAGLQNNLYVTYDGHGIDASGVALDGAGDLFIADPIDNEVLEVPANGGPTIQVWYSEDATISAQGVAVDGASDVFITIIGPSSSYVQEIPYLGNGNYGSPITVPTNGLSNPMGVAVDGGGDVFIADTNNSRVVVVPYLGNGNYGTQITVPSNGLNYPQGVAARVGNEVFIADTGNSRVLEIVCDKEICTQNEFATDLANPDGVALDRGGDVFVSDGARVSDFVVELPYLGNGNYGTQITVASGLQQPLGVAVDGAGDLFIADLYLGVVEVRRLSVNYSNVSIGANSTGTLPYNVAATTTFGTPKVLTQGASSLDFAESTGGTCTGTVTAGNSCTLNVTFAPLAPGVRQGAVELFDNSGNLLVSTLVYGIGRGPAVAFEPGAQTTVDSNPGYPLGVAVDAADDVFFASSSKVLRVAPGGTRTTVASGLGTPFGVAVDGAGDVFIADEGNARVYKVPYNGTYGAPITVPTSGLSNPTGVAVDGAGDVFIADSHNSQVYEVVYLGNGNYDQFTLPTSGLSNPIGVAVDGAGDVFIADSNNGQVVEVPYFDNGTYGTQVTVPTSGLSLPYGVAVDAAGNVFIADSNTSRAVEVPYLGNGNYGAQITIPAAGLANPFGVAVDAAGNVFIADNSANLVVEVNRSQPPSLTFASTPVGQTSSDSPQSVSIQNIGNQPLNAVSPGLVVTGPNFLQVAGTGAPADCAGSFALSPGETCNLSISFEPQSAGTLTSTAVFTDNTLNANPSASQSIALQGVGTSSAPAIISVSSTAFTLGASNSFTVTTTGHPTPSLSESGALPIGVSFQDNGNGTGTLGGIPTQAGSFSIAFTANNGVSPNATQSFTLTVNKLSTTTSLVVNDAATNSPWAGTEVSGASAYASSTVSSGGGPAPTGTVTYSFFGDKICFGTALGVSVETLASGSVPHSATVGPLSAGIYSFNASYSGDSNYNSSFSGCVSFSVSAATVNVTVGTSPAGLAFSVDGTPYASTQSLTWNIGDMHTIATTSPQFPSAGTQDTFAGWSDSGAISHAVTASASTTSYTANFNTSYQLTTAANPTIGGTVTPASGTYYAASTIVGLTATANANYAFSNWTGNVANANSASTTVTMSGPQSVTANFAKAQVIVSPTSLNFGNVVVGRLSKKVVTMTNTDKTKVLVGPITLSVSLGDPSQFALDHVCPTTLKAGTSCSIGVTFRPDAVGPGAATLNIVTSAPGSPIEVPITAAGIAKGH